MNQLAVQNKNAKSLLESALPSLMELVPKHITGERMLRVATGQLSQNPKLAQCDPTSLLNSVIEAAQLGIEIGVLNQGWLIPYGRQCQFQLGYGGLITLAKNSGDVMAVTVEVVREKDHFVRSEESIDHQWEAFSDERGDVIGVYCILTLAGGVKQYETMSKKEVEKIRQKAQGKNAGPWKDHWEEMAKKTVLKRALKKVKLSPEAMQAVHKDDQQFGYVEAKVVTKLGNDAVLDMLGSGSDPTQSSESTPKTQSSTESGPGFEVDPVTGEMIPEDLK